MSVQPFVTTPGQVKRNSQLRTKSNNIGLVHWRWDEERTEQLDWMPVTEPQSVFHLFGELRPAVRINCMIAGMSRIGHGVTPCSHGPCPGKRDEDHVTVWNDGLLHRLVSVMTFGNFRTTNGLGGTSEEEVQVAEIGNLVLDDLTKRITSRLDDPYSCEQFLLVPLPIIH